MTQFRQGGFQQIPPIVKNLLIINVLVFIVQQLFESRGIQIGGHSFEDIFALHYWQSPNFRWWQLFTHMFMHANIMHIFFNMFGLWMFGRILEGVLGPQKFIIFYIVCGLGGAICHLGVLTFEYSGFYNAFVHYQQNPGFVDYAQFIKHQHLDGDGKLQYILQFWSANKDCSNCAAESLSRINEIYSAMINESMLGASGAIMGILFGFGYLFPNTELYIYFIPIPIKAKWVVAGYAILELTQGVHKFSGDNIAHFAHLGGMLFAFILLRIWKNKIWNRYY